MNALTKNIVLFPFNVLYMCSPKLTLCVLYAIKQKRLLNINNPELYTEKLQWIKLYDKNPLMPICCDKYWVRSYVEECGCGEILNDLIWEGENPEEIPFESLPEQFVIKATHGSTFNIICKDRKQLNRDEVVRKCSKWLHEKFLPCYGEWFYGVKKPRIIVEKYLENREVGQLIDYKVFCFNGKAAYIVVDSDRFTNHKRDVYDTEWKHLDDIQAGFANAGDIFSKPNCLEKLLNYAEKLSKPFLHARVDFYVLEDRIVFGEITFTNGSGFDRFDIKLDKKMGSLLKLKKS